MMTATRAKAARWLDGIRHVCVDKDGTLTDVHAYWAHTSRIRAERLQVHYGLPPSSLNGMLDAMGVDPQTDKIRAQGPVGYAPRSIVVEHVVRQLAQAGITTTADEIQHIFRSVDLSQQESGDYHIAVLPGAAAFLQYLHDRGVAVSIYTSDRRENVLKILERLALRPYVAEIIGGDSVDSPKPNPEGFLLACQRVGIVPAQSAYIGDTVEDLKMALAGGAGRVIGVGSGLGTLEELSVYTPHVCTQLTDLVADQGIANATIEVIKSSETERIIRVIPDGPKLRYLAGQYGSLGLDLEQRPGTVIKRPYSLSSSIVDLQTGALIDHHDAPYYEFYFNRVARVAEGREPLTPQLFRIRSGDRIFCGRKIVGYYTAEHVPPGTAGVLLIGSTTGESANNSLVNHLLRERPDISLGHVAVGPEGWESLYRVEHQFLMDRWPAYRYHAICGSSYRIIEERLASWLRTPAAALKELGFLLDPKTTHVFLCGDPEMIGAPKKKGGWQYDTPRHGCIALLRQAGFALCTRFARGQVDYETYW